MQKRSFSGHLAWCSESFGQSREEALKKASELENALIRELQSTERDEQIRKVAKRQSEIRMGLTKQNAEKKKKQRQMKSLQANQAQEMHSTTQTQATNNSDLLPLTIGFPVSGLQPHTIAVPIAQINTQMHTTANMIAQMNTANTLANTLAQTYAILQANGITYNPPLLT